MIADRSCDFLAASCFLQSFRNCLLLHPGPNFVAIRVGQHGPGRHGHRLWPTVDGLGMGDVPARGPVEGAPEVCENERRQMRAAASQSGVRVWAPACYVFTLLRQKVSQQSKGVYMLRGRSAEPAPPRLALEADADCRGKGSVQRRAEHAGASGACRGERSVQGRAERAGASGACRGERSVQG